MSVQFLSAEEACAMVPDYATVGLIGGGGGLVEATLLHEHMEKRFLDTGRPKGLTCVHALGIGDRKERVEQGFDPHIPESTPPKEALHAIGAKSDHNCRDFEPAASQRFELQIQHGRIPVDRQQTFRFSRGQRQ